MIRNSEGTATIYLDDCMEILKDLPQVRAVITDPPYSLNITSNPSKIDLLTARAAATGWYVSWLSACREKLTPDGCLWTFLNWRGLGALLKASGVIDWKIQSVAVWHKDAPGTCGKQQLRPTYELIALFAMPDFVMENRSFRDVIYCKYGSYRPHGHPTEKPENLMSTLIENSTKEGDTVLDPFMGSGTTGAAALKIGRRFIGVEHNPKYFEIARARLGIVEEAK